MLNHRLLSITEEMGIQYMRCSGSNVLITGNDAATAIMLPDGLLSPSAPIVTQGNVLPLIVASTQRLVFEAVGWRWGHLHLQRPVPGAIHQPDFATVAPIFYEGTLVGWVGASSSADTGHGPGFSSGRWTSTRKMRIPPVTRGGRAGARTSWPD